MNRKQAEMHIVFLERLPKCVHGHWLMDWGFSPLEPPCGCRLDEVTEAHGEVESQLGPEATELAENEALVLPEVLERGTAGYSVADMGYREIGGADEDSH